METRYNANGYAHRWVDGMHVGGQPRRTYREIAGIDARGNLTERAQTLGKTTLEETFAYDSLNRLIQSKVAGKTAQNVSYDGLGNITAKTGVGDYVYGDANHPHRLTQADSAHFVYDANGNVIQEHETGQAANPTRSFAYTPFNKAASIKQGTHTTEFEYGPDRSRTRRVDTVNTGAGTSVTTTLYFGGAEKVIAPDGSYTWKRYVADGFLIEQTYNSHDTLTKEDTRHLLKDHLGSIALILDEAGLDKDLLPLQRLSYDAWGQRRAPDDWTLLARLTLSSPTHGAVTPYGYTGHEMLDAVGIIHMNGRIYDPKLGRFLQADPVIQFPNMAQNHNRYSYVLNNPLAYVDPSGYFIGKLLRKVVGLFINGPFELLFSLVPQLRPLSTLFICASGNPALCAMAAAGNAYASGASLKQSLKAGVFAYVSAQAFAAVGDYFTGIEAVGGVGHWGAHALTGGILAELQGGEFGHGFLAAGVAFGVGRLGESQSWSVETQLAARAVSAGTVSEVTGGKFANGAMTAAFAYIFNELAHSYEYQTKICNRSESACTEEIVWPSVKRQSVPFQKGMLKDGDVTKIPGVGSVRTLVDDANYRLTNRTEDDHLFKGTVTRSLVVTDDAIYVRTVGVGANTSWGIRALNYGASSYFPAVADMIVKMDIHFHQHAQNIMDGNYYMFHLGQY